MRSKMTGRLMAAWWVLAVLGFVVPGATSFAQQPDAEEGDAQEFDENAELDEAVEEDQAAELEDDHADVAEAAEADQGPGSDRGAPGAAAEHQLRNPAQEEAKRVKQLRELVRRELDLRDDQIEPINEVFEEYIEELLPLAKEMENKNQQNTREIQQLRDKISEARKEGDRGTVRELLGELRAMTGADGRLAKRAREFHQAVTELLDPEQARAFSGLLRKTRAGGPGQGLMALSVMRRALREIDLSPEQREATNQLFAGLQDKMRSARSNEDEGAVEKVIAELREAIAKELNQEQMEAFEAAEERLQERFQHRGGPRDRGARGGRRGERPAADVDEPADALEDDAVEDADDEIEFDHEAADDGEIEGDEVEDE